MICSQQKSSSHPKPINLSCVIPVYRSPVLAMCLRSALEYLPTESEIIVVENGCFPETLKTLDSFREEERIKIIHGSAKNAATARNEGFKESSGKWVLFLDADVILSEVFSTELSTALEQDFFPCMTVPLVPIHHHRDPWFLFRYRYHLKTSTTKGTFVCSFPEADWSSSVFVVNSACFAIRREHFIRIEGFRQDLKRCEDTEFSSRLAAAGTNILVLMNAKVSVVFGRGVIRYLIRLYHDGVAMACFIHPRFIMEVVLCASPVKFPWNLFYYFGHFLRILGFLSPSQGPMKQSLDPEAPKGKLNQSLLGSVFNDGGKTYRVNPRLHVIHFKGHEKGFVARYPLFKSLWLPSTPIPLALAEKLIRGQALRKDDFDQASKVLERERDKP